VYLNIRKWATTLLGINSDLPLFKFRPGRVFVLICMMLGVPTVIFLTSSAQFFERIEIKVQGTLALDFLCRCLNTLNFPPFLLKVVSNIYRYMYIFIESFDPHMSYTFINIYCSSKYGLQTARCLATKSTPSELSRIFDITRDRVEKSTLAAYPLMQYK
jgi:hypothetical protein